MRKINLEVEIKCELDQEYFAEWDELSLEMQKFWHNERVAPNCEGSGVMDTYCKDCKWCKLFDVEEVT